VKKTFVISVICLIALMPADLMAHAEGEDYVWLSFHPSWIEGHFEIHFEDLRDKLGVDIDPSTDDALQQVTAASDRVHAYIRENFAIGPDGAAPFELDFTHQELIVLPQGNFAQFHFRSETGALPDLLAIRHSMLYENDRLHRGLVMMEYNAKTDTDYPGEYTALIFSPGNREQTLDLTNIPSIMAPRDMIAQGVRHIWIGIDHILFLLALMLSTVVVFKEGEWQPVEKFPSALWNLLKIVTVFTVAHSITLLLAALDVISVPSRVVESIIALSIILVGLNNIFGRVREGTLLIILTLGLFHGLGFASVMGHLPFRMVDLLRVVIGFNIGVELGQVIIVAALFPLLFLLRKSRLYEPVVLKGVSAVLVLVALGWFVQRAFGLE